MKKRKVIIAVTGASGSMYARLLAEALAKHKEVEITVIISENGYDVMRYEDTDSWLSEHPLIILDNNNLFSPAASGSAGYDAMVIIPCSMGTLGKIAAGTSDNLICRSADVMLKERRKLIIVPRESPVSSIHLRNMLTLSGCGAVILPASPSFYQKPQGLKAACNSIIERILRLLDIDGEYYEWGKHHE